jgi:CRISPR-associated protein Cas5d
MPRAKLKGVGKDEHSAAEVWLLGPLAENLAKNIRTRQNRVGCGAPQFYFGAMDGLAEGTDVSSGAFRPRQQLLGAERRPLKVILRLDSVLAAFLADFKFSTSHISTFPYQFFHLPPGSSGGMVPLLVLVESYLPDGFGGPEPRDAKLRNQIRLPGIASLFRSNRMKEYLVQLEISGPTALWSRPDTMPNPVSYVAPTLSASKGVFEAILRWKSVNVHPVRCEICAPVQFHRYAFNYGGPLRKSKHIKDGASLQIFAQVLINVCYRLYASVAWNRGPNGEPAMSPDNQCAPHAYVDAFNRRLEHGQWFYTPCLGWKEFAPDYVGPFREETNVCTTENHVIPAFLEMVFDSMQNGARGNETYLRAVNVKDGVLEYKDGEANSAE